MSKELATSMEFGRMVLEALKIDHLSVRSIQINIEPSDFIEVKLSINVESNDFKAIASNLSSYKLCKADDPT